MTTWTTAAVLDWTVKRFTDAGIDGARLEAQVLLAHALGCTRVQLYTGFDRPLDEDELKRARELIKRRLAGEPVAYLVGTQEFWSLPFFVDENVLVPRHDTETVVQLVLDQIVQFQSGDKKAPVRVLDLCTGSGVLAVTLAKELPAARVVATDVSEAAAVLARKNAEHNKVNDRLDVRVGDLFAPVGADVFDVIVANPPYIATAVIATLDKEVQREPRLALDGGADGLDLLRRLVAEAAAHLAPDGLLALEHGYDQADAVQALVDGTGAFTPAATVRDLGKQPRVTWARLRSS
ncbi:MAG TPA: peptide chain release factor N(5)-glutamine methyltransferase [Kofleriaceae bacterium]|nr:peptide chain release factor N(5)-glutamine methyltransferase [Kofleriaceae bacterium]